MVRDKIIKIVVSAEEKCFFENFAHKSGLTISNFFRNFGNDFCHNRLIRLENVSNLPQFESLINQNTELISTITELQRLVKEVNLSYELERDQNMDAIAKLDLPIDQSLEDRILKILELDSYFLDQISEKLPGMDIKMILKSLANLRRKGVVEQDLRMRWFLC